MTSFTVSSGQTSSGLNLNNGDSLTVMNGGTAVRTAVNSGSSETVQSGGVDQGAVVNLGGSQTVQTGGTAVSATVNGQIVIAGMGFLLVPAGGLQIVQGSAVGTTIAFGTQIVSGGTAVSETIVSGGTASVVSGGTLSGASVGSGSTVSVGSGGLAIATTVGSRGSAVVGTGGTASLSGLGSNTKLVVQSGGTVTAPIVISSGMLLDLQIGAVLANGGVVFAGTGGTLQIDGTGTLGTTVSGFRPGDVIDLTGLAFLNGISASLHVSSASGDTTFLSVAGGVNVPLSPSDNFANEMFALTGISGTQVTLANGELLFSSNGATVTNLGIKNGSQAPAAVAGAFNLEVFTGLVPNTPLPALDPGFQAGLIDLGGVVIGGYLAGAQEKLFGGDYLVSDALGGNGSPTQITLGSGNQTVVGAPGDMLIGGSGNQVLNAAAGGQTVTGGTGNYTVYGGANDFISGSTISHSNAFTAQITGAPGENVAIFDFISASAYTIGGGAGMHVSVLQAGTVQIGTAAGEVIDTDQNRTTSIIATAGNDTVEAGGTSVSIYGGVGDSISPLDGAIYIDATAGNMTFAASSISFGNDTIVGGPNDTIVGSRENLALQYVGPGSLVNLTSQTGTVGSINAIAGSSTIILGTATAGVALGSGGSVTFGTGNQFVVAAGGNTINIGGITGIDAIFGPTGLFAPGQTINGGGAALQLPFLGPNSVLNLAGQTGSVLGSINSQGGNKITLPSIIAGVTILGGANDTVTFGGAGSVFVGRNSGDLIPLGSAGTDTVFSGGGGTILGGAASLGFNANGAVGDLINLAGTTGNATINAFQNNLPSPTNDTVITGNGSYSVWGGGGDRIGVGPSSPGGLDLFDHSTTVPDAAVAFGTNDSVTAVTYTGGTSIRASGVSGASTGLVTITNFNTVTDTVFYAGRSSANVDAGIIATAQSGGGNTIITLPDGTQMTFIGLASAAALKFAS